LPRPRTPRTPPPPPPLREFEEWWPVVWGAVRDVLSFVVGVWILLFKNNASISLQVIGLACLGVTASGIAQRIVEDWASRKKDE
jgi:hypothetical protein